MVLSLPYMVEELGGDSFLYGLFMAGFPLGYLGGYLLAARLGQPRRRRLVMLGSLFGRIERKV